MSDPSQDPNWTTIFSIMTALVSAVAAAFSAYYARKADARARDSEKAADDASKQRDEANRIAQEMAESAKSASETFQAQYELEKQRREAEVAPVLTFRNESRIGIHLYNQGPGTAERLSIEVKVLIESGRDAREAQNLAQAIPNHLNGKTIGAGDHISVGSNPGHFDLISVTLHCFDSEGNEHEWVGKPFEMVKVDQQASKEGE